MSFIRVEIPFVGFEDDDVRRVIECAAFEAGAPIDAPETVRAVTAPAVRSAVARIWARHYLNALIPEGATYAKIERVRPHPSGAITAPVSEEVLTRIAGGVAKYRDFLTLLFPARPAQGGVFGFLRDGRIRGELFTEIKRIYLKALKRALRA